ncbi:MAG: cation diffusion facilitator transporter [Thermoanaerobaculum sp.]|nr:MAG: cation diffusion facilitator transporter [Thermoanaerobaculum sp.]
MTAETHQTGDALVPHRHGEPPGTTRPLAMALGLAATYMGAEVVGGLLAHSLALLADALHMLSDAGGLALALFAARIARRPPSPRRTYGYYRAEILAALANGATLAATAVWIVAEAYHRLRQPPQVRGPLMLTIAVGGLLVNLAMLAILRKAREENLNTRGAWLHVLTDTLGSVQAIAAGVLITAFGWRWADPVASLLISVVVLLSGWRLLREASSILMEGVPGGLDIDKVRSAIAAVPGVAGVHDLHVWSVGSRFVVLSAHVEATTGSVSDVLRRVGTTLRERFNISHSTIQVEFRGPLSRGAGASVETKESCGCDAGNGLPNKP